MQKVDLLREIAERESGIEKLRAEIEKLRSVYLLFSDDSIEEKPIASEPQRKDASGKCRAFFLGNRNKWSRKSEIANSTGIADGSIQNVLSPPNSKKSDFESKPIRPGGRNLVWRMKKATFDAEQAKVKE